MKMKERIMLENKAYVELYKGKSNGVVAFATVFL